MPGFAIRGLHYDIEKGLLLKLDSFLQIQLGSVYRGLTPVSDAEVIRLYRNRVIPLGELKFATYFSVVFFKHVFEPFRSSKSFNSFVLFKFVY